MDNTKYEALIARLEKNAAENPRQYIASVIGIALLGFGILGIAVGFSLLAVSLLIGIVLLLVFSGVKIFLFLAKLGKILILLIIPAWSMMKTSFTIIFSRFPRPEGRELTRQESPALFERLGDLQIRMNGPRVHKVLLTDELNAAIVQHPRFGLFGWEENYLILGFPLLLTLSEEEMLSVVAHEYGHLSGHHSRLSGFIYRLRSTWERLHALTEQWNDWGSRLIAKLFRWYAPYFNAYTFVLARQNEYVADRIAVEAAGLQNAANALIRTDIAAQFESEEFWPSVNRLVVHEPEPIGSRSSFWMQSVDSKLDIEMRMRFMEIAFRRKTDYLDTHPSLNDRLAAIGAAGNNESARQMDPPHTTAAAVWLGIHFETIQAEFDLMWQERIAEEWHSRHSRFQECETRLAQLGSSESPSIDEQWERITLLDELMSETDLMPLLNSLIEQAPDHLQARFRRGTLLLSHNDESGIDDVESVMAAEPDAIIAGCEAAWRFYQTGNPEKAADYLRRWQERLDYLNQIRAEFSTITPDAILAPADLDEETLRSICDIIRQHGKYIRTAYMLRRILKTDNHLHDYVLAFETKMFTLGEKGPEVVMDLAKEEFPVPMFIVHLGSAPFNRFRKSIKELKVSPVVFVP